MQGCVGDLGVMCGGLQLLVPEQHLDDPDIDLLLQQMGGEAMAQRVKGNRFVDPGRLSGVMEGSV